MADAGAAASDDLRLASLSLDAPSDASEEALLALSRGAPSAASEATLLALPQGAPLAGVAASSLEAPSEEALLALSLPLGGGASSSSEDASILAALAPDSPSEGALLALGAPLGTMSLEAPPALPIDIWAEVLNAVGMSRCVTLPPPSPLEGQMRRSLRR